MATFKRWCAEKGFNNARNLSHVLMDGGKLSIPCDKLPEFHEKYIDCVREGETLFVVEQKTTNYHFFVDLDYKAEDAMPLNEIESVCKIICDKVKRHGGKDCLVSVSPPKRSGKSVKTGVHLNWHGFIVNQASALALREHILVALSIAKSGVDWEKVVDSAVYGDLHRGSKGSGFRMPWSHKKAKHEECQGRGCEGCSQSGKINQLAYLPVFMYRHGPALSMMMRVDHTPDAKILDMASVRTESEDFAVVEPPSEVLRREGGFSKAQMKDEVVDLALRVELEMFINKYMEGQGAARVTKLFKFQNQYLVSTTSRYCENTGRDHGSNHVWFYISGDYIAQKCFCRCEDIRGRKDGFCRDFVGRKYVLTTKLRDALYEKPVKCPEIKKKAPSATPGEVPKWSEAKLDVEKFLQKYFGGHENTKIIRLVPNKKTFTVITNSTYCGIIDGHHDKVVSFSINLSDGVMNQRCACKVGGKKVKIYQNVLNALKQ
jgi:hypothetical protein